MSDAQWSAGKLLNVSGSYWQACALHAGVKLEIFSRLGDERLPAVEIANRCNSDERGTIFLANALAAMGLLSKTDEGYANTPAARKLLVKESENYVGYMLLHHHHLMQPWSKLDQAVCSGKPVERDPETEEQRRASFLMGMFNIARGLAPTVAQQLDLQDRRHLLDLGGGPGTYAIHFCQANPGLRATVYDLPTTRPFAQKTIARYGPAGRIDFVAGDYLRDPLTGTYDAAWLSQILHSESPRSAQLILQKAVAALAPGGRLYVHEFILHDTRPGPLFPALFALNMLVGTESGRAYSERELREMMARAGLRNIRRLTFQGPTESGIILGVL